MARFTYWAMCSLVSEAFDESGQNGDHPPDDDFQT